MGQFTLFINGFAGGDGFNVWLTDEGFFPLKWVITSNGLKVVAPVNSLKCLSPGFPLFKVYLMIMDRVVFLNLNF